MSQRKQPTLAAFGFSKKIIHRKKETKVEMPAYTEEETKRIKCSHCKARFTNQQGLSLHIKCKHAR